MLKYKALICDIDGTLVNTKISKLPSEDVKQAIDKIRNKIHVGVATSRPYDYMKHIGKHLNLSGPSIITGGAQIVDMKTGKTLWEQVLSPEDYKKGIAILIKNRVNFFINDNGLDCEFTPAYVPNKPYSIVPTNLTEKQADKIAEEVSRIPTLAAHKIYASSRTEFFMDITDVKATKQHAILKLAEILSIATHEIIGIGDGHNDRPLLMACGLKIAMGNAPRDLKAIADYVAPSVEEDGVVDVIEKFLVSTGKL